MELIPNLTSLPSKQLCRAWAFVHVGEYTRTIHTLVPNTHATPSNQTTWILHLLHPPVEVDIPPFVNDFHPKIKVTLNRHAFISTLVYSSCISSYHPLSIVYEILQNYFVLDNSMSDFNLFFEICGHIVQGHVPPSISHLFFASQLLTLEK